jgi:hypothetical protein
MSRMWWPVAWAVLVLLAPGGGKAVAQGTPPAATTPVTAPAVRQDRLQPFSVATKEGERWGYRNGHGDIVIAPRFAFAGPFHGGLARAWVAIGEDPEGKEPPRWGFIMPDGQWAIAPRFRAAGDFADGLAPVQLEKEFVLIDTAGTVRRRLHDAAATPPLPSAGCATLEQYVAELGGTSATRRYALDANPVAGEARLGYLVTPLRFGTLAVKERGWEGENLILVLPGRSQREARALLAKFAGDRTHEDVTGQGGHEGAALVWRMEDEQTLSIRVREDGGVEIAASLWAI